MSRHLKDLKQVNEEDVHTRQENAESERFFQHDTGRSNVSMNALQRTIAQPGRARPEDLRVISQVYGNQAVMRLVEKARLERQGQVNATTSTIQRLPIQTTGGNLAIVQREDEEVDQIESQEEEEDQDPQVEEKRNEIMKKLKKEKKKRGFFMLAKMPVRLFKELLILPVKALDQLTVLDLHIKDAVKYLVDGKTRKQRMDNANDSVKKQQGTAKRAFGRTGLTGYLHGYKSHKMMYSESNSSDFIPGLSSKYNPLNALDRVGQKKMGNYNKKIKSLEGDLKSIDNPESNEINARIDWE